METRRTIKNGSWLVLFMLFVLTITGFAQETDAAALASVTDPEEDRLSEILSYISMGVGIVGVVWVAWMLSNKSPKRTNPSRK